MRTISNKAMSKNGSEDVVMEEQGEGPATAMSPSPGYGAIKIRHILESVSPNNVMEYRALLDEAGFDTRESLALPYSEFREEVTGIKSGHARALLIMVAEERERMRNPRKLTMSSKARRPCLSPLGTIV